MKGPAPKRWLKLARVADLMAIEHQNRHYRVQYVRRLLRRLEARDGTAYLRRFGSGRSNLYVSPVALEQLEPYSPTALGKLREDVEELREEQGAIKLQVNGQGSRIRDLEKARRGFEAYMRIQAEVEGQSGAEQGHRNHDLPVGARKPTGSRGRRLLVSVPT
jgi:hypothetical protein